MGLLVALIGTAAGGAHTASAATTIKLGHLQAPANHQQQAALRFAEQGLAKAREQNDRDSEDYFKELVAAARKQSG